MCSTQVKEQGHKHRRHLVVLGWVAFSALLLVGGSGCGHETKAKADESATKEETMMVSTTTPKTQLLRRFILQPGILKSYEETPIYTKLAGYLETINVDIGDRITKGELLAELWVPEVEEAVRVKESKVEEGKADVTQAEAALEAAEANIITWKANVENAKASVIRAQAQLTRWEEELKRNIVYQANPKDPKNTGFLDKRNVEETAKQRDAADAALREARAGVGSAEASLEESTARRDRSAADVLVNKKQLVVWERELEYQKRWFEYADITAPYDGIVTRRIVHTGHFVQPTNSGTTSANAEPLFVVMRTDILRCVVQVPEYDAPLVKDGADSIVRLQAYRGQEIKCKVTRSSWALDKDARTLRVELFLNNPAWINLTDRVFDVLQKAVWFRLTDQSIVALKSEKVPDAVLAKLNPMKNKDFSENDFAMKLNKVLNGEAWLKLTDLLIVALKSEKVPDAVLAKLNPMKNKDFSRDAFVEEINKLLGVGEAKQWESLILKRAIIDETKRWENLILKQTRRSVPAAVLAKLNPMKNKELPQKDFEKEIAKILNAGEMEQFRDILLKRGDSPNAPMKLQAGMYGNISITADIPNALTLPAQAILTDGNKSYCFVIEDGKARRVNVKVGITNDTMNEILAKQAPSGPKGEEGAWKNFTGSEQVITSNLTSIQDGQPVKGK